MMVNIFFVKLCFPPLFSLVLSWKTRYFNEDCWNEPPAHGTNIRLRLLSQNQRFCVLKSSSNGLDFTIILKLAYVHIIDGIMTIQTFSETFGTWVIPTVFKFSHFDSQTAIPAIRRALEFWQHIVLYWWWQFRIYLCSEDVRNRQTKNTRISSPKQQTKTYCENLKVE